MQNAAKKTIAVIDGNSWVHRAYHAVPSVMFLEDGTPTNAVHGFMNMFLSFYGKAQPDAIICAFDAGIPKFRLQAVEQYKAQRKPMDNELRVQFPIVEEILKAMDIPVIKVDGWEGDDVLGSIAAICEDHNMESLLVTGDKDANQLASSLTKIVNMKKGVSDVVILGPDEVFEKYGVTVDQFIDYLALMGDSSDNIPGVPGIGPKSASKLLAQFGSLEGLYSNLDQLKGKQLENIKNNKDAAYVSRQAATISIDVPLNVDVENIYFPSFSKEKVSETFLKYRLKSNLAGVLSLIGESLAEEDAEADGANSAQSSPSSRTSQSATKNADAALSQKASQAGTSHDAFAEPALNFENYLTDEKAIKLAHKFIDKEADFAIALGKKMPEEPVQTSLFDMLDQTEMQQEDNSKYKDYVLALSDNKTTGLIEGSVAIDVLKECVQNSKNHQLITENSKDVLLALYPHSNEENPLISKKDLYGANIFDISLAAYVLDSAKSTYSAIDVYTQIFNTMLPTIDAEDESKLNKKDDKYVEKKNANIILRLARRAAVTYALVEPIKALLKEQEAETTFLQIEKPLTPVLVDMERVGTKIDAPKMANLSISTKDTLDQLKKEIYQLAGEEFNIDSPKQLGHILFEVLGLPAKKKTKTGYSTNAAVLEDLAQVHDLPKKILQYREYAKIRSTYIEALPALQDKDGLIHTTFHQRKTTTGRLSSSDPNIQNIPTRSAFGAQIRECFIPLSSGEVFLSADYSQIELRMLAHLSQDKSLIEAFNSGMDFHAATAAQVFGLDPDAVTKEHRRRAKAVNFGIIYGQQAYGLAQSLQIGVGEAKEIIDRYFATFPQVKQYLDSIVADAYETGYAKTLFGRRRYIKELKDRNRNIRAFGERTAMNHPMQGSAADIIKLAMRQVEDAVYEAGLHARCMMQVHDELDFSVSKDEAEQLAQIVKDKMENVVKLNVPLVVDVEIGANWNEVH